NAFERFFIGLNNGYRRMLVASLKMRPLILLLVVAVAGSCYFLFINLKSELAPIEDRGVIFTAGTAPEGSTIDFTAQYIADFENLLNAIPEVELAFIIAVSRDVNELISISHFNP